ncbi:GNAT family N-acetyltransferase [Streptomyces tateyamensis]|uniref:GNAT family N-acetyltransferase n=1 Tax=Streptomyces tateyamensis TaxID=565073 RepID=A0A2V4PHF7_9ACTN|nr:GNAT family N-acetyltransferase [Streptomyces tateyamensis]PYC83198.1 GNAT family N-acetyltransferase [Streptomyces tateyamensis]
MTKLSFAEPVGDAMLADWQHVHNVIIATDTLSLDEVRERAGRNCLEVAYLEGEPVGCTTVRPPASDSPSTATVIARVLPALRHQGFGEQLYQRALERARALGATTIETVVLASNEDGLRFAETHGFVEIDRYVLPGDTIAYVDLRLA